MKRTRICPEVLELVSLLELGVLAGAEEVSGGLGGP